ncbi:hypothetical protein ACOMHN_063812 [Nucella lapillus]
MTSLGVHRACRVLFKCHGVSSAASSRTPHSSHHPCLLPSSRGLQTTPTHPIPARTPPPHTSEPPEDLRFRRFNVGALGAGRIGKMHLRNVCGHQRLQLKWVVEDNVEMQDMARRELYLYDTPFYTAGGLADLLEDPGTVLYDTPFYTAGGLADLLEDPGLDGVFILTPTETHASLIMQALERGKAVFVEKPTAETREEIEQCYSLAEAKGTPLFTGFQRSAGHALFMATPVIVTSV